jgi:hypothetical protein
MAFLSACQSRNRRLYAFLEVELMDGDCASGRLLNSCTPATPVLLLYGLRPNFQNL